MALARADTETQQATAIRLTSRVVMKEPSRLRLDFVQLEIWQGVPMPYFNFDLVVGTDFKSQGGMILEDTEIRDR